MGRWWEWAVGRVGVECVVFKDTATTEIYTYAIVGSYDTELTEEFLRAFAFNAGITLHAKVLYGRNTHHKIEAIFKALAHALRLAVAKDPRVKGVPSSKGVL